MTITDEIDYLWQVIRDSERSDEFPFLTDEELRKADAARLARQLHSQPEPATTPRLRLQPVNKPAHNA